MFLILRLAAWIAVWAAGSAAAAAGAPTAEPRAITCVNPASGATWRIKIDYDKQTVDSDPARISDKQIEWRDGSNGGNYTLDLKSGDLTVIIASSTGGWLTHDRCRVGRAD